MPGRVFKAGTRGLGYYADGGSFAAAAASEGEGFRSALSAESAEAGAAVADDGPDAPIIAALASHRMGLAQVAKQTEQLETEAGRHSMRGAGLKHAAEVLEVKLTDQLLMLDAMLGDCETSEGRVLVKAVVAQVRALGTRLLRFSVKW